jgi:hypothetical protein
MRRSWAISIHQHEQRDDAAWPRLTRLVEEWNSRETPKFEAFFDFTFVITFDESTRLQMDRLLERLEALGATYHLVPNLTLEDDDYATADFIELFGTDLEMTPPLVVNEAEAFGSPTPCPRCGSQDLFDIPVTAELVIDETRLHAGVGGGPPPGPGGWDAVHLPNGDRLVSAALAAVLQQNGVEGYELHEVIDAATGKTSRNAFRLTAEKAILTPCPEHTLVAGDGFCSECGTALGSLEGPFYVRSDWIGDDEVISRHPGRGAMLYVSRRVYDLLDAASLEGLHRGDILLQCRH